MKGWVNNLRNINPKLKMPELDDIVVAWETPRNGDRFKILKVCFKSSGGLITMRDLLRGSKLGSVAGLPGNLR